MRIGSLVVAFTFLLALVGCEDETSSPATTTASSSSGGGTGGSDGGSGGAAGGSDGGSGGAGGQLLPQNHFLYVANRGSNTIDVFEIGDGGELTSLSQVALTGGPAPLAVNPSRTRLYAAQVSAESVTAYDLDPADGALSLIGSASLGIRPVYVSVDNSGGYLLVASYGDNVARSYRLNQDGSVDPAAVDSHNTGTNPHAIITDPSNQYAFVPNTNSDAISQFAFSATTGVMTANTPAEIGTGSNVGPRHLTFHPSLNRLYVVNEHADSVTTYDFAPSTGLLSALDTHSTLPGGSSDPNNTCADIHITPDGQFLYASNRGDDSLAIFSVDAAGSLTAVGHAATEPIPREFEVTPDGRFVYAAGQQSGMLAAYRIESSGQLTPLATYTVGDEPLWVLAVSVPAP